MDIIEKLDLIQKQLDETKKELTALGIENKGYSIKLLLSSESYRLKIAILENDSTNIEIAKTLGISERTLYRLRKKYKL